MATSNVLTQGDTTKVDVHLYDPACAWVRSTLPVMAARGVGCAAIRYLGEALTRGILAVRDTKRTGFFEITIDGTWFYFHVSERLGYVYLITCRALSVFES